MLDFDVLDLGRGVRLQRTYAHLMAPYLMAFKPAPLGEHHPEPWKAASGGLGWDITAELVIPDSFEPGWWLERYRLVQWLVAMIRLWVSPTVTAPVISNMPFADAAVAPESKTALIPHEVGPLSLRLQTPDRPAKTLEHLEWVQEHWGAGEFMLNEKTPFSTAIEALDGAHFVHHTGLALVSTWSAIESLFAPAKAELRFRVTALLASYLEESGAERRSLQKKLQRLYDSRSSAAHGDVRHGEADLVESMEVLRRALIKMITACHVPSMDELDRLLFGDSTAS